MMSPFDGAASLRRLNPLRLTGRRPSDTKGCSQPDAQVSRASPYLTGAIWAGFNAIASVLLPFAMFVFFAREIRPSVLGVVAFATACVEVFKAIALPGLYEALLQQKKDVERCDEAAAALLLGASAVAVPACLLVLYGLGFVVSGLHVRLSLVGLLVLKIPLDLLTLQPQAVLVRRLAFRRLAMRTIVANVVAGALGILIALCVGGVGGLVAYQLGQSVLTFGSTALGRGLLARPSLHRDCIAGMRSETLLSTGNRALAATINYVDQMAIAPLAGDARLAYYNLGKRLETTFVTVANSFSAILFQPLFAADGAVTRQVATVRALLVLTFVCGIPAAVVFSNSREVVGLLFGRNWLQAAPVVGWLSINGFVRAIGMVPGSLLSVSGRNRELLVTSIASGLGSLALVGALASTSIALCAMGMTIKNAAIVGWMAWLTRNEVRQPLTTYATAVVLPAILMVGASGTIAGLMPARLDVDPLRHLAGLACSGFGSVCVGSIWIAAAYALLARLGQRVQVSKVGA